MTSYSYLFTIVAVLVIPNLIIGSSTEESEVIDQTRFNEFYECRGKANTRRGLMHECTGKEFTEEQINATLALHGEKKYIPSKHICRKQNEIFACIKDTADEVQSFSNKSVTMVPFVRELVEKSMRRLCDNDAEFLNLFMDEDHKGCVGDIFYGCRSSLGGADDLSEVAICDYPLPEEDIFDQRYICQKYLDFMKCAANEVEKCSAEMKKASATVISMWINETPCSEYLNNTIEN